MAAVRALPALAAVLLLAAAGQASKYSREANEGLAAAGDKRREAGEFRVVRLNQVWEKAQRVSGAGRWRCSEGLRARARPLRTRVARQGDGEERGPVCEETPGWPQLGAAVAFVVFSGMTVPGRHAARARLGPALSRRREQTAFPGRGAVCPSPGNC